MESVRERGGGVVLSYDTERQREGETAIVFSSRRTQGPGNHRHGILRGCEYIHLHTPTCTVGCLWQRHFPVHAQRERERERERDFSRNNVLLAAV